jgi:hypothetical protein
MAEFAGEFRHLHEDRVLSSVLIQKDVRLGPLQRESPRDGDGRLLRLAGCYPSSIRRPGDP